MSRTKKAKPRKPRNYLAIHAHNRKAGPEKNKKDKRAKNPKKIEKLGYSDEDLLDAQIKREEGLRLQLELEHDRLADDFE